jgi:phage terminase small subunit
MSLSIKQRLFVQEYLTNGFNATRAAMAAGYSMRTARQIGAENLTKPYIRAEIDLHLGEITLTEDEIRVRLAELGRADIGEFVTIRQYKVPKQIAEDNDEETLAEIEIETVERAEIDLVKAVKACKTYPIEALEYGKYGLKIKMVNKLQALELAGRARGMFQDNVRQTVLDVDMTKLTDEQLERIAGGEDPIKVLASVAGKG